MLDSIAGSPAGNIVRYCTCMPYYCGLRQKPN